MMPEAAELPRVLVATSNNFDLQGGGGITLSNLFRGWPVDRLANVHEDSTPPDRSVCANFFRLTGREVHWSRPFSLFEKAVTRRDQSEGTTAIAQTESARGGLKRAIVSDGVPRSVTITPQLSQSIDDVRAELVYGFLGSVAQIRLVRAVADRWQLPIALHIMDDWPATVYASGLFAPPLRRMMLAEFRELLDRASLRLTISDAMAAEYCRRYGGTFEAFHNALRMEEWRPHARTSWTLRPRAEIRYVGSILAEAQRDAIRDVCDAVVRVRDGGRDVRLAVSSPRVTRASSHHGAIRLRYLSIRPAPDPAQVPGLMGEADVLLLPFNFNEESARYLRFSMPTKVPAYMISGSPVLVYGPRDLAAVSYAMEPEWAHVVTVPGASPCHRTPAPPRR